MAPHINPDPLQEGLGLCYADFLKAHKKEKALLPNPYYEDPELIFGYRSDDVLQEVEIYVLETQPDAELVQKAVVENYCLNRLELRQLRYEWYDFYVTQKMILEEPSISAALRNKATAKVKSMMQPKSPFAGMVRFFENQA